MRTLESNLKAIQEEKNTKIIPENIKAGLKIFDIVGTLSGTKNYDEYLEITQKILGYYKEYIELEYIENTEGQYIDTGVQTTSGYRIESSINITRWYENSQECYFSGCLSSGSYYYRDYAVLYNSKLMLGMNTDIASNVDCSLNTWYNIDMSTISGKGHIKLGNETLLTSQNTVSHNAANIWLFGVNNNGTNKFWNAYIKMGATKIYDATNTLVRDFIPVRMNKTNEIGMYDKLNKTFYPNNGSGTFTAGPEFVEKPPIYKQLEYIESTNGQYIDTEYMPNNDTSIELQVSEVGSADSAMISSSSKWQAGTFILTPGGDYYKWYYNAEIVLGKINSKSIDKIFLYREYTKLNDTIISSGTSINSTVYSDTSLWVFGGPSKGTQGQFTKFRLHSFKISESGITDNPIYIKDFIPVQMIETGENAI